MSQTYIGSTLRTGSDTLTDTVDGGYVVVSQTGTVTTAAAGTATSVSFTIPAYSQIINFIVDGVLVAVPGAGTATTAPITIGTAAAGTQYLSATDAIAGGRIALAFTAAQTAAMASIGATTTVVATVDPDGTIVTTQGIFRVTIVYAQKV